MTISSSSSRVARFLLLVTLLLVVSASDSKAGDKAKPFDAIKAAIPDSISLDGKVVYVDFWASWCLPCRQSFPWMQEQYEKLHKNGLEIVAVSVDTDHKSAMKFLDENKVTFPVLFDSAATLAKLYDLKAMPTSFIYDRDGSLVSTHLGFVKQEADSVQMALSQLLDKGKSK
jgi:thiol-disulfide isomerase/thioredoxin